MMVANPMGIVPKNIDTVEWPKICLASSKNNTQRLAYISVNRQNSTILKNHKASPNALGHCATKGSWPRASARIPVPIVAANQLGVNCRIASRGLDKAASGWLPPIIAASRVSLIFALPLQCAFDMTWLKYSLMGIAVKTDSIGLYDL